MKTRAFILYKQLRRILFLLLLMTGCGTINNIPKNTPAYTSTTKANISPSPIAHASITPPITNHTSTIEPKTPSITPGPTFSTSPTSFPSITPLPTLPSEEVEAYIRELLHTNDGCRFPCWWGIKPGTTSWQEAKNFLSQFGQDIYEIGTPVKGVIAELYLPLSDIKFVNHAMHLALTIRNDIVDNIIVYDLSSLPDYQLDKSLTLFGMPEEIWLHSYHDYLGYPPPIELYLFYPQLGIIANFYTLEDETKIDGNMITGCFSMSPVFGLWSPEIKYSFTDMKDVFRFTKNQQLLTLTEATGMDVKTFYDTYKNPNQPACIETSMDIWPDP